MSLEPELGRDSDLGCHSVNTRSSARARNCSDIFLELDHSSMTNICGLSNLSIPDTLSSLKSEWTEMGNNDTYPKCMTHDHKVMSTRKRRKFITAEINDRILSEFQDEKHSHLYSNAAMV